MLTEYAPIIITGASLFIAIGLHCMYKTILLPSFLAAICTSAVSLVCFRLIAAATSNDTADALQMPWNANLFAFGSGFVLALLIGYLMKLAPTILKKL